jgi:hypothetical protein
MIHTNRMKDLLETREKQERMPYIKVGVDHPLHLWSETGIAPNDVYVERVSLPPTGLITFSKPTLLSDSKAETNTNTDTNNNGKRFTWELARLANLEDPVMFLLSSFEDQDCYPSLFDNDDTKDLVYYTYKQWKVWIWTPQCVIDPLLSQLLQSYDEDSRNEIQRIMQYRERSCHPVYVQATPPCTFASELYVDDVYCSGIVMPLCNSNNASMPLCNSNLPYASMQAPSRDQVAYFQTFQDTRKINYSHRPFVIKN